MVPMGAFILKSAVPAKRNALAFASSNSEIFQSSQA